MVQRLWVRAPTWESKMNCFIYKKRGRGWPDGLENGYGMSQGQDGRGTGCPESLTRYMSRLPVLLVDVNFMLQTMQSHDMLISCEMLI